MKHVPRFSILITKEDHCIRIRAELIWTVVAIVEQGGHPRHVHMVETSEVEGSISAQHAIVGSRRGEQRRSQLSHSLYIVHRPTEKRRGAIS